MNKQQPSENPPTPQEVARYAFARREKLSRPDRRRLSEEAFGARMPLLTAWKIVTDYAGGQLTECGDELDNLTQAWLTLGSRKFDIVFNLVLVARRLRNGLEDFKNQLEDLAELSCQKLERLLQDALRAVPA